MLTGRGIQDLSPVQGPVDSPLDIAKPSIVSALSATSPESMANGTKHPQKGKVMVASQAVAIRANEADAGCDAY